MEVRYGLKLLDVEAATLSVEADETRQEPSESIGFDLLWYYGQPV